MRDDLEARFLETQNRLSQLRTGPPVEKRILLWMLCSQATCGDYSDEKVDSQVIKDRSRHEVESWAAGWRELKGVPRDAAKHLYLRLADTIRG
ncbi:acyl-CoA-binding protein [Pseudomonas entomophila]|uniref:Acyl-CoA-binding protein n=2 Tax=Pseudomonas entomophila TaxID=312306 RepID=Q1I8M0_PSEE4|nr:acyl-CoA-binding protein [Pseudomonas entomophila]WMW08220.1 hypothetical protein RAH46_13020 [Pseudomonas entomophila]CAK16008.1 hypothetical protein PSEEN3250 [Pseudomonas entomophila L48]